MTAIRAASRKPARDRHPVGGDGGGGIGLAPLQPLHLAPAPVLSLPGEARP